MVVFIDVPFSLSRWPVGRPQPALMSAALDADGMWLLGYSVGAWWVS